VILLGLLAPAVAWAQEAAEVPDAYEEPLPEVGEAPGEAVGERELSAMIGEAAGFGDVTAGGLRISGAYLYQLSDLDWFDGGLAFTVGKRAAECFRDRADELVCDHGINDGTAIDLHAGVRRFFPGQGEFRPWLRPGLGVRMVRFSADDLTGVGAFLSAAGGIRARVTDRLAIGGRTALELGGAIFGDGYGAALQVGLVVGVDVEVQFP
jgi:hypothetical protein